MKKYNLIQVAGLIIIFIMFNSCKKWIDTELNTDPNKPSEVSLALQLPATQDALAYTMGGDLSYAALIWMQQLAGGAAQPLAYDHYSLTASDVNNAWNWNLYAGPMEDLNIMIKKANGSSPYYAGIAKVQMALAIGTVTDLFGDVPYSTAWNGENDLKPTFDKQQDIYTTINALLDGAILDFAAENSIFIPGTDDMIYGGDLDKWTKAAYALKARYALHLCNVKGAQAYTDALDALNKGFSSNADDMTFNFGEDYANSNPFYQFYWNERPGDIVMAAFIVDTLFKAKDPRLTVYFDTTSAGPFGSPAGAGEGGTCDPGAYFASSSSPVNFISYVEQKFIEAECKFMTDDPSGAATAYNDAVKASLGKYDVNDAAWEALYANENSESISLKKIMYQKYFGQFLQVEVFTDWRRTGFPILQPSQDNVTANKFPRRYPYPTAERVYNGAHVPTTGYYGTGVSILDRVYWDKPSK